MPHPDLPTRRGSHRGRRAVVLLTLVALTALLAGCGPPPYRFYASDSDELVLKVPRSWTQVRAGVPVGSDGKQATGNWVAYYDAAPRPSADHVQSTHATSPVAVTASLTVTKEVGGALTDDELRDEVYPVSAAARTMAQLSGFTATRFTLYRDEPIRSRTARGVHVVFAYDHGQGPEVYDQIAVTDTSKTHVHVLLVHCTRVCYDGNRSDITETVRSFTVKIA
jgi:hypothetical protein